METTGVLKYEKWYHKRLRSYFNDHYGHLEDDGDVEWFANPDVNIWLFDIPNRRIRVELSCDRKGHVTEQHYNLKEQLL